MHKTNFAQFYPFYLSQHQNRICRGLHFTGCVLILLILAAVFITHRWMWLAAIPIAGYGLAWAGHFFFEKNRPATFQYPLYSLIGDWVMFADILRGKIKN